jgi:hypothetical protein
VIDFLSVVPADQIVFLIGSIMLEVNTTSSYGLQAGFFLLELSVSLRLLRLLRLVRLVKIKQLLSMDKVVQNIFTLLNTRMEVTKLQIVFYFRISVLVSVIVASGHFLGCVWLMIGRHNVLNIQNPAGWMVSSYDQGGINQTKDFVSCIGGGFDAVAWNSKHGASCDGGYACAPVPEEAPYDVDCSWIRDRKTVAGGTGFSDGVGASEGEQYLSAFYFSLVTVTTVGYGDILPDTPAEKQFVVMAIIVGAFCPRPPGAVKRP